MFVRLIGVTALATALLKAARAVREQRRSRQQEAESARQLVDTTEEDSAAESIIEREHVNPPQLCWCHPDLVMEPGNGVDDSFLALWCHKGHGDEPASPQEIAQAIRNAIIGNADG